MDIIVTRNAAIHMLKHNVFPREIHDAGKDTARVLVRRGRDIYFLYAKTPAGRRLAILLFKRPAGFFAKSAHEMMPSEKRLYQKKRKTRRNDEADEKEGA